jgi:hypothetical protein
MSYQNKLKFEEKLDKLTNTIQGLEKVMVRWEELLKQHDERTKSTALKISTIEQELTPIKVQMKSMNLLVKISLTAITLFFTVQRALAGIFN